MTEEKMDFFEWRSANRDNLDDDIRDTENRYVNDLEVLTFRVGNKGFEIISTYRDQIVFVDKNSSNEVAAGETWLCRLRSNSVSVWYAMPVLRITLSEVMNFNEELRENVLSSLWAKNRKELTLMLEERLRKEIQEKLITEVNESNSEEKNRLKKRIEELESELHETRFQLDAQEKMCVASLDDDYITLGSEDTVKVLSDANVSEKTEVNVEDRQTASAVTQIPQTSQIPKTIPQIKRVTAVPQKFEVERISDNSLRSPSFTDRRYFAHLSPDYHTLVIRPDDEGRVYCLDNVIRLEGLGRVSPFTVKKFLPAEYSEIYEGMIVRL